MQNVITCKFKISQFEYFESSSHLFKNISIHNIYFKIFNSLICIEGTNRQVDYAVEREGSSCTAVYSPSKIMYLLYFVNQLHAWYIG